MERRVQNTLQVGLFLLEGALNARMTNYLVDVNFELGVSSVDHQRAHQEHLRARQCCKNNGVPHEEVATSFDYCLTVTR